MPQKTELELPANPPAERQPPAETHSASPPPAPAESYFKLHPRAPMFLVIAALLLLVGGYFTFRYFSMYESTDDAEVDGHLMPLSARITGYVIKVNVDDNQYVEAGTVLA
jgi:membrane fusion protein (multidrug efflux system)